MKRLSLVALAVCAAFAVAARPQEPATKKVVEKVPIQHTSPASGEEMYASYCAACHGKTGKGDGPAASALKQAPPDLTVLARNNNGKFPTDHVAYVLRFGSALPAHGSKDMPVWGKLFESLHGRTTGSDAVSQLRVSNLTRYLESLQAK
jgi:mono/diheme cytochrome c family protein